MATPLEWIIGATSAINLANQGQARATLAEDIVTPEQEVGSAIQDFANRGIDVGADSPAVLEALRRRNLEKRQRQAQGVLASGGDPLGTIFGIFQQD